MESHRVNSLQYNIGEKPTVTLYTYINHHVGTPKQKPTIVIIQFFGLNVPDYKV